MRQVSQGCTENQGLVPFALATHHRWGGDPSPRTAAGWDRARGWLHLAKLGFTEGGLELAGMAGRGPSPQPTARSPQPTTPFLLQELSKAL